MPYTLQGNCVHKKNADGSVGEKVPGGCHDTRPAALAHMHALEKAMMGEASKAELSMEDRQRAVNNVLNSERPVESQPSGGYIVETFDDYVVVCWNGSEYYKVPYSIGPDGSVVTASKDEWIPVEQDWVAKFAGGQWASGGGGSKRTLVAVKAMGDWELDVLAIPFGADSDGQIFDESTDLMPDTFSSPAILYHHGIEPGVKAIQKAPVVIGKALKLSKQKDGWHVRVLLDKTKEFARKVWEAAKQGVAVASSDSINHLARLRVNGRIQMYDKSTPGNIAVWPLAGVSLWDHVEGNFHPASRYAVALPAMKAIYREAGLLFPEIRPDAVKSEAEKATRLARVTEVRQAARAFIRRTAPSKE